MSASTDPAPARDLGAFWPAWLPVAMRERLEGAYADPGRGYHDRLHLSEVLHHVDELADPDDPAREAVLLAAWFHDAVYDGGADDEERSALLAEHELAAAGAGAGLVAEVARLVRLTVDHRPGPDDHAGGLLCDADLGILAADDARYASYTAGVRREYAHVPDADFAAGRAAVLRDLLAKPALFHGRAARARWEGRARANLAREVAALTGARPTHRPATRADLPTLEPVVDAAIEQLQTEFLDADQVRVSHAVMGIDTQLVDDGTYVVVELAGEVVGCGGWSRRATLYGGDHSSGRDAAMLDPATDAARVRAMYTRPGFERRGVGSLVLRVCEEAAAAEGFHELELMATLSGRPLYASAGFAVVEEVVEHVDGVALPLVRMRKPLAPVTPGASRAR